MKLSIQWLREFVPVELTARQLAHALTLAGLEIEAIEPAAPAFEAVFVGAVLEAIRHPNAEKLSLCSVTTDGANRLRIVCGAPNVRAGLKVAVAIIGARLPNDVRITRARLRGVESEGMLCSARELGIGSEHDGILELPADLPLGADLRRALDLDDEVLEVKISPNRGDCMSVLGIARDFAAASQHRYLSYRAPPAAARSSASFPVLIEAPNACPVFAGRAIRGIDPNAKSPLWLKERLRRAGLNSLCAVVDVTNYVMIELGQPMHAYDLDKLAERLEVRWARPGESVELLDGKRHELDGDSLIIADAAGPVGLAGIMGGSEKAIGSATTDVFLEAAHFAPEAIAAKARRSGLLTDAAQRFERGVDPALPQQAIERATVLLLQIAGGETGPAAVTRSAPMPPEAWVRLRRERLDGLLGAKIADAEVAAVLNAISDRTEATAEGWRVRVPTHRFDLHIEADLIEEVARLHGFERIAAADARMPQRPGAATETRAPAERILLGLVERGYREAITYSFANAEDQRALFPDAEAFALRNPISAEFGEMRVSLWPGLLRACAQNLRRQQSRVRLFEVGRKYLPDGKGHREIDTVAGVASGSRLPEQWSAPRDDIDFYDVKADVMALLAPSADADSIRFANASMPCLRPGRCAQIFRASEPIGWIGELHPKLLRHLDLNTAPIVFDLEIERAFICNIMKFNELSKFPRIRRDLAIVVDESVPFAAIEENVSVAASGLLKEFRVFDVYRGAGIDSGRKSVALGLILQDSSRTLTDDDADAVVASIAASLRQALRATIRDQ